MGSKTEARQRMQAAGVPVVPGLIEAVKSFDEIAAFARDAGFPIMIKASAGGGGKGAPPRPRRGKSPPLFPAAPPQKPAFFRPRAPPPQKITTPPPPTHKEGA